MTYLISDFALPLSSGMAYGMLAGLPPVFGLYLSFVGPLLYALLGRCPQISLGEFVCVQATNVAVMCTQSSLVRTGESSSMNSIVPYFRQFLTDIINRMNH